MSLLIYTLPSPLKEIFKRNIDIYEISTRHIYNIAKSSFIYECPNKWIKLNSLIKNSKHESSFNYKMKQFISQNYYLSKPNLICIMSTLFVSLFVNVFSIY